MNAAPGGAPSSAEGAPVSDVPPLWFTTPEGFFALPVAATQDELQPLAQEFVRGLYSEGDEALWDPASSYYAAVTSAMASGGLSYAAMGLFSTESGGVVQCALTVAAAPTEHEDPDVAAQGILAALRSDPLNDARWLDLPCGPSASCVTVREVVLDPAVTASGEETKLLTGQIQVHVPFPHAPCTAVFTLHTASVDYWAEWCDIMNTVLRTVAFSPPEEAETSVAAASR
ncbi:hypothetical protein ABZ929_12150 [Streptomyces physcomitrii]|uniref:hypothetical protein n=1 Tax=Streptomyces physcomitrii TaxID=2724184 RepID=UPI0033DBA73E